MVARTSSSFSCTNGAKLADSVFCSGKMLLAMQGQVDASGSIGRQLRHIKY
jgi:hypothetical protein